MTLLNAYLYVMLVYLAWAAYIDRLSARDAFLAGSFWPLIVLLLFVVLVSDHAGWEFEIGHSPDDGWGFRRPEDNWPGFAIRCPWLELQFWKKRKPKGQL